MSASVADDATRLWKLLRRTADEVTVGRGASKEEEAWAGLRSSKRVEPSSASHVLWDAGFRRLSASLQVALRSTGAATTVRRPAALPRVTPSRTDAPETLGH